MSKNDDKTISRRGFLRGGLVFGAATVTGVLTGCAGEDGADGKDGSNAYASGFDIDFAEEYDVIVVGGGGAGLTSALEAANAGASVLLLEKRDALGGSTALSGGVVQGSGTTYQQAFGITGDSAAKHEQYWLLAGEGAVDEDLVSLLAANSGPDVEWLGGLGAVYEDIYAVDSIPYIPADLMLARLHVATGLGHGYVDVLQAAAESAGVTIRLEAPAAALIQHPDLGIVGVTSTVDGADINIRAKRAVILASGGFDRNPELARAFSPQLYNDLQNNLVLSNSANEGDGLKMGMNVGADLAGMGGTISYPAIRVGRTEGGTPIPGIWVNAQGQRFVNEAAHYGYVSRAMFAQQEHIVWAVFDETVRQMGGATIGGWSDDLSSEIESGKIVTADTPAGLAAAMGVNAGMFPLTLAKWNNDLNGDAADSLFGREVALQALDTPPYFATRCLCYNVGSVGGLKIDTEAHVIDTAGAAIPGLYAAGMVSGGFIGPYYPGSGTAVCATLVFGRIAGRNAAAEEEKVIET
ncbi:MAG: FAD-dependent oxidoreductase [Candidatus Lernaella stagnicola]|nr:FAD-dependent oxidoreductase [Candidatus Lernaella stagnicola]